MQWGGGGWVAVSPGCSGRSFLGKETAEQRLEEGEGLASMAKAETGCAQVSVKKCTCHMC